MKKQSFLSLYVFSILITCVGAFWVGSTFAEQKTADEISITVLPFKNLSNDPNHEYLDNIFSEDTTNTLGKLHQLLLIVGKEGVDPKDMTAGKQAAQTLGVRYILTGSLNPANDKVVMFLSTSLCS